jgi:hypothetical protein
LWSESGLDEDHIEKNALLRLSEEQQGAAVHGDKTVKTQNTNRLGYESWQLHQL